MNDQNALFRIRTVPKVSTGTGIRRVAKRRIVVGFALARCPRFSKVSAVAGSGGSWSRNAKLSSLLDSPVVLPSRSVNSHRIGRVVVAKRRIDVGFALAPCPRVYKVSTGTGSGGSWSRNAELTSVLRSSVVLGRVVVTKRRIDVGFASPVVLASQQCQESQDRAGHGRETQNCHRFWTRPLSSLFKSVSSRRIGRVVVAKRRIDVGFALAPCPRVYKMSTGTGSGGSWSRNAERFCARPLSSGGSWSRNAELTLVLRSPVVLASRRCQQSHLECDVYASRRGSCGDAKVDSERRS